MLLLCLDPKHVQCQIINGRVCIPANSSWVGQTCQATHLPMNCVFWPWDYTYAWELPTHIRALGYIQVRPGKKSQHKGSEVWSSSAEMWNSDVRTYHTTWCYNPEDSYLQSLLREIQNSLIKVSALHKSNKEIRCLNNVPAISFCVQTNVVFFYLLCFILIHFHIPLIIWYSCEYETGYEFVLNIVRANTLHFAHQCHGLPASGSQV